MKPGRELDALIAEKVMGWKWSELKHRVADPEGWSIRKLLVPPKAEWVLSTYDLEPGMNSVRIDIPPYSTNISAAWEVVEKLKQTLDEFEFEISCGSEGPNEYEAAVRWVDNDGLLNGFFYSLAKSPAHAICLAALKALGVDIPTT